MNAISYINGDAQVTDTLDAVAGNAVRAHRLANLDDDATRIAEVTRHAIRSWRRLAGLSVVNTTPMSVAVPTKVPAA
jgi:hypothetical protein